MSRGSRVNPPVGGPAKLVLATGNAAKVSELRDILAGLDVILLSAGEVDLPDVEEDRDSFAGNAVKKARSAAGATGLPALADDSGLVVDALDGAPGVLSARYAASEVGGERDDEANLQLVLERMAGQTVRTARFVCAAALAIPHGDTEVVEAFMEGTITEAPRGEHGFGYDPIFLPRGASRTTAEMTSAEKHRISHRGKAFRALRQRIAELVVDAR